MLLPRVWEQEGRAVGTTESVADKKSQYASALIGTWIYNVLSASTQHSCSGFLLHPVYTASII